MLHRLSAPGPTPYHPGAVSWTPVQEHPQSPVAQRVQQPADLHPRLAATRSPPPAAAGKSHRSAWMRPALAALARRWQRTRARWCWIPSAARAKARRCWRSATPRRWSSGSTSPRSPRDGTAAGGRHRKTTCSCAPTARPCGATSRNTGSARRTTLPAVSQPLAQTRAPGSGAYTATRPFPCCQRSAAAWNCAATGSSTSRSSASPCIWPGTPSRIGVVDGRHPLTPFERKYSASGQTL
jgi:hypothetical protein